MIAAKSQLLYCKSMTENYAEIEEREMDGAENLDIVVARRKFQLTNIVLVGVVFMLLSSASQTCSTVEVSVS